ncbi:response regulator [Eggerthellaceae bacterium zg-887]|nr:response regulator [Xiamenia xianingshaonis]
MTGVGLATVSAIVSPFDCTVDHGLHAKAGQNAVPSKRLTPTLPYCSEDARAAQPLLYYSRDRARQKRAARRHVEGEAVEDAPVIAIVEDDRTLGRELARLLSLAGFSAKLCPDFSCAADWIVGLDAACAVVDLKLPGADGHAVIRDVRARSLVPIIMLTSSDSEFDEVMAMNLGADDYVCKPYRPAALIAHIQALLRRSAPPAASTCIERKGVVLDLAAASVSFGGKSADLTHNELKILGLLMRNPGVVLSRSEIMCELWESDVFIDDNTLTVNVNRLRKTLRSLGVPDDFLVTRRGQGYAV